MWVRRRAKLVVLPFVAALVLAIGASLVIFHHALALDPGSNGCGGG